MTQSSDSFRQTPTASVGVEESTLFVNLTDPSGKTTKVQVPNTEPVRNKLLELKLVSSEEFKRLLDLDGDEPQNSPERELSPEMRDWLDEVKFTELSNEEEEKYHRAWVNVRDAITEKDFTRDSEAEATGSEPASPEGAAVDDVVRNLQVEVGSLATRLEGVEGTVNRTSEMLTKQLDDQNRRLESTLQRVDALSAQIHKDVTDTRLEIKGDITRVEDRLRADLKDVKGAQARNLAIASTVISLIIAAATAFQYLIFGAGGAGAP